MMIPILNMCIYTLLWYLLLVAVSVLFLSLLILYATTQDTISEVKRYQSEKTFVDPINGARKVFPFNEKDGKLTLSVVVPAYNEEERLPVMLDETLEYLQQRQKKDTSFCYEIIVVDDGSKDATTKVALKYVEKHGTDKIRVLTLAKNRGKGGAVRLGIFCTRGQNILFVDADGATKFSDLDSVEEGLNELHGGKNNMALSVGSRAHLQDEAVAERTLLRNFLMYGFHFLVSTLCVKGVRDTQCGFKLLTRSAAFTLFSSLHVERWAFDVELLYIAQSLGIPIAEKAVNWQEIDGSKMVPIFSWLQMGKDLLFIRARYVIGAWKINPSGQPNVIDL